MHILISWHGSISSEILICVTKTVRFRPSCAFVMSAPTTTPMRHEWLSGWWWCSIWLFHHPHRDPSMTTIDVVLVFFLSSSIYSSNIFCWWARVSNVRSAGRIWRSCSQQHQQPPKLIKPLKSNSSFNGLGCFLARSQAVIEIYRSGRAVKQKRRRWRQQNRFGADMSDACVWCDVMCACHMNE